MNRLAKCDVDRSSYGRDGGVYWPVRHIQFVSWDDRDLVTENAGLGSPRLDIWRRFGRNRIWRLYTPFLIRCGGSVAKAAG